MPRELGGLGLPEFRCPGIAIGDALRGSTQVRVEPLNVPNLNLLRTSCGLRRYSYFIVAGQSHIADQMS